MALESTTPFYDYEDDAPCDLSPSPQEVTTQTYVHSIICAFGLIGNILVIVTYVFYKRAKTMTDIYLINVAVADLILVVALPFIVYNERHAWVMGVAACKLLRSAYSINLYAGMLLLACISGDRYVAIVQARRSFGARSRSLMYGQLVCLAVWALAAALTVPTLIYTQRVEDDGPSAESAAWTCQPFFDRDETARLMKVLLPGLQMAVGFLLPLVVMLLCYSCIVRTLLRAQNGQKHKAVRVVMAVVLVFVACHLPYNVTLLVQTLSLFKERSCQNEILRLRVLAVSRDVAYLHCCLNPILYAFIGVRFRSHFKQVLVDLWCFSKKYIYSSRSSRATSEICVMALRSSEGANNMSSFTA